MRKVILSMMVSLDGYIEGPDRDINWHVWDEEMATYMGNFFNRVDTLLFGRHTYELMLSYWPAATTEDPVITDRMNNLPKIVFSKTLEKVEWNSRLVKENIAEEVKKLKQLPGKDMVLFGGADIASVFIQQDLIDEYQLIINPVVIGKGTPLFKAVKDSLLLKLTETQPFGCGNVVLHYEPAERAKDNATPGENTQGGMKGNGSVVSGSLDGKDLLKEVEQTTAELLRIISSLNEEELNKIPFEGSWTAAQVGEHLLKSYGLVEILNGRTIPTERPIDEKVPELRSVFLNFDIKMESPEFIVPSDGWFKKERLLSGLQERTQAIVGFSRQNNLSVTCLDFELPGVGPMTRLEWVHFLNYHTQRHNHQLRNIVQKINIKMDNVSSA